MPEKDLIKDYEYVTSKFENFKGELLVEDFRTFLLLTMSSDGEDIVNKFLEGGNPNKSLWYDVEKNGFFLEIPLSSKSTTTIYHKTALNIEKSMTPSDDSEFFDQYLSKFEQEVLVDKKMKLELIKCLNKTVEITKKYNKTPKFEIVKVFDDLLSYLFAIGNMKSLLVLKGEGDKQDILFSFSMSITNMIGEDYIPIFAFVDHDKVCDKQFLKIDTKSMKYESVEGIKQSTHGELFNTKYLLLVRSDFA